MNATISSIAVFAGLPVRDLQAAVAWYEQLFGRGPDGRPAPQVAEYYLSEDRVPERGTLQLIEDPARAGGGLATINVEDLTEVTRALETLRVPFEPRRLPIEAASVTAVTVGTFQDPDGNAITMVQPHRRP
jgi:glyoxylase I family protein